MHVMIWSKCCDLWLLVFDIKWLIHGMYNKNVDSIYGAVSLLNIQLKYHLIIQTYKLFSNGVTNHWTGQLDSHIFG